MPATGGARTRGALEDQVWSEHASLLSAGPTRLKVSALPTQLARVDAALPQGRLGWYPLLGLGFVAGDLSLNSITAARTAMVGGSVVVEEATAAAGAAMFDAWGAQGAGLALHRAVKDRFDPQNMLAPGRFIGGI
jgi:glycolate dehydrogenase FAD-binding subunit